MTHRQPGSPSLTRAMYNMADEAGIFSPLLSHGVSHGDDMALIFAFPYSMGLPSNEDQQMSHILTSTWASFVDTG